MYENYFKLLTRPFLAAPATARYFPAAMMESARQTLVRCIARGEGPGLIIGPPGIGKSLLCQLLAQEFADRFAVALLVSGRFGTRHALLQAIAHELALPYRNLGEGELRLALVDRLDPSRHAGEGLLLVIDEAHTLPWKLLEEVRLLTNLVRDGQPRVRVVLAGGPSLEERFASPRLSSLSQRLAARCYLSALNGGETAAYVCAQIAAVGGDGKKLFDQEALATVQRASDGIPRLINQICDHALILACLGGLLRLTSAVIEEAWADLQQLPLPWQTTNATSHSEGVVEFGRLDETPEARLQPIPFPLAASQPLHVAEPDEQLDDLDLPVPESDCEIGPLVAIGQEIELDFPEFDDPFGRHFAEEEVVLDRYAPDFELFSTRPKTTSREGRELAAMLEPWSIDREQKIGASTIRLDVVHAGPAESLPSWRAAESIRATAPLHAIAHPAQHRDAPRHEPNEPIVASLEITPDGEAAYATALSPSAWQLSTAPSVARTTSVDIDTHAVYVLPPGGANPVGDRGVLVVEDDQPSRHASTITRQPGKPKREFRQLFSKLRRG